MRTLILLFLLLLSTQAFAQSRAFDCDGAKAISTSRAKEMLQTVQDRYSGVKTLSARFIQESYLSSLDVSETSEGLMKFQKPGSMRWDYSAPEEQQFIINGDVVYFYQPIDKQLVIDAFNDVLISDLPVAFLMGIGNLTKDFSIQSACENRDGVVFDLSPQKNDGDEGELKELKLLVTSGSLMPIGGKVIDVSGNKTAIVLKDVEHNAKIDPIEFKGNFPKGIDVTDRRNESHE